MQDKDIIYISNSGSVELSKFLNLINGVSGSAASVPANAVTTSNAVGDLVN
jgi:polysaccharide export outer membrane protein